MPIAKMMDTKENKTMEKATKYKKSKKNKSISSCVSEIQMNCAVLGSSYSGKTSIVKRFLCGSFSDKYNPTSMDVFEEHYVYRLDATNVDVSYRIFDITGSDDFPAMRRLAINSAEVFVIVYAMDDRKSFEQAKLTKTEIFKTKESCSNATILLVANKCDLSKKEQVVSSEEGRMLAKFWGCYFAETSAKFSQNIDNLFAGPMIQLFRQKYPEMETLGSNCSAWTIFPQDSGHLVHLSGHPV